MPGSTRMQLGGRNSEAGGGRNTRRHERGIQLLGGMMSSRMPGQAPGKGAPSTLPLESQTLCSTLGSPLPPREHQSHQEGQSSRHGPENSRPSATARLSPRSDLPGLGCKTSPAGLTARATCLQHPQSTSWSSAQASTGVQQQMRRLCSARAICAEVGALRAKSLLPESNWDPLSVPSKSYKFTGN